MQRLHLSRYSPDLSSKIVAEVKHNPELWAHTAILITFDEGGGYWDAGYIQPLDCCGDDTRMPAIIVSPVTLGGKASHTYADHLSFLEFIESHRHLRPVLDNSRDNLPNPISHSSNRYVPINSPAIGNLMDVFDFH